LSAGLRPDPLGELKRSHTLPDPLAALRSWDPGEWDKEGRERGEEVRGGKRRREKGGRERERE